MLKSVYLLAIATCLASPLALAQNSDRAAASASVAVADASQVRPVHTSTRTTRFKSRSVFGQAITELTRSVEESRAQRAQVAQTDAPIHPAVPTSLDAKKSINGGQDVAVQSEPEPR